MSIEDAELGHPLEHFVSRRISIDWTGPVRIAEGTGWGLDITIITSGHDLVDRSIVTTRPVVVEKGAQIYSNVLLYNCTIGEGAVVAAGTVVRSRDVPPWTLVEGNPAAVIAKFNHKEGRWVYLDRPQPLKRKK